MLAAGAFVGNQGRLCLYSATPPSARPQKKPFWTINFRGQKFLGSTLCSQQPQDSTWFGLEAQYLVLGSNWLKSEFSSGYVVPSDDLTPGSAGWVMVEKEASLDGPALCLSTPTRILPFHPRLL